MTISRRRATRVAATGLAALLLAAPAAADALQALDHGWAVDASARTVAAFVTLDRAPDFASRDEHGRLADQLQYWFDDRDGVDALAAGYQRVAGLPVDGTQTLVSWEDAAAGELVVRRISSAFDGWGPEIGRVAYTLDAGHRLAFSLPWALLASADGSFSSAFESYRYGGWGGQTWTTYAPPVPEPSSWALFAAGLALLAAVSRRAGRQAADLR